MFTRFIKKGVTDGHLHAWCLYEPTSWKHFIYIFLSVLVCRAGYYKSLTTHLPLELQHKFYSNVNRGRKLIKFGQFLAALFRTKLYWENAPLLNYEIWNLKHGQTEWELVPHEIFLCFDTGHAMLGAVSDKNAQEDILSIFRKRRFQIKHLHIHENDLIHDNHDPVGRVITKDIFKEITNGRTYIFEK
ncbi:MAG: hypothetical protein HY505_01260 [Candidatus Yanofskybacteria bacterium]|nr:hypothetical protein [Candidatus Yanofskybacteria bacterium]